MPLRRPISKMDTLMFMTESTKRTNDDVKSSSVISQNASAGGTEQTDADVHANDPDIVPSSMQRPVDLYKVMCVPYLLYTYWKHWLEVQV
jgi:G patch domain-containing protein 1